MRKSLVLCLLLLGGCELYFGGDDKPPPCTYYGTGAADGGAGSADFGYRNPQDGTCQYFGGYPYPCDGTCGPCPEATGAAEPDWGSCYSYCEGLSENQCVATAGCYAAYLEKSSGDNPAFWGCWQTAPSGPVAGSCAGLNAHECSRHDNCSATYIASIDVNSASFVQCNDERQYACQADTDCATGQRCDTTVCNPPPGCDPNCPNCGACPDVCYGVCVPKDPNSCTNVSCDAGYHCEEHCYGSGTTNMMSTCEALCVQDLTCASVDCGPGYTCSETCTTDANGNTTCHPTCVQNQPDACETLQSESSCISRGDCVPVYNGQDCTCYPDHCTCQTLTYERCESLYMPL
jgi:hypothetical protein